MKTGLRVGSVKLNSRETEKTKTEADSLDISRAYYTEHDFKSNDQFCRNEVINNEKYSLYNQERKVYFIMEPNGAQKSRKLSFFVFLLFSGGSLQCSFQVHFALCCTCKQFVLFVFGEALIWLI